MKLLLPLSFVILSAMGCHKHTQASYDPLAESAGPSVELGEMPLTAGNMWVYDNGDTIRVAADTMIAGAVVKKVTVANHSAVHISYYANGADGMYLLGTNGRPYSFADPMGFVAEDSITWFATPMRILKYPVAINDEWNTNEPNTTNALRGWMGYASITNRAGAFNCVKLRGYTTEYYAPGKGLVRCILQPECLTTPCPPLVTNLVYINF